jgi:protein gp37
MGAETKIAWTDHTFNPWMGCTKVNAACKNCYAEELMDHRYRKVKWGPNGTRVRTVASNWAQPVKWNKQARADGVRRRVFCASLADVFEDRPELHPWRQDLFELIERCKGLDWQLLTKRPENVNRMISAATGRLPEAWFADCKHVWIGASAGDQKSLDEVLPHLRSIRSSIRYLSCEPLLEKLDFRQHWVREFDQTPYGGVFDDRATLLEFVDGRVDWVIVGGESGDGARPCALDWIRTIVEQCRGARVPVFVKQLGKKPVVLDVGAGDEFTPDAPGYVQVGYRGKPLRDSKGGDIEEFPEDLRVREFPVEHAHAR